MKRVLVTGGAGFIGSHTCKALAQAGYEPIVYDDLSAGYSKLVKWGPLAEGDTRDVHRLGDVFQRYRPSAVVHFAARIAVGESVTDPASHYSTNVTGTLTVLEAMRAAGVDQIVFSSSAAVYGIPQTELVAESHALAPINPYGRTKLIVEQALADFSGAYGLRSLALRYFNAAGADPEGDTGELHNPETHLIPLALDAVTRPDRPLTVFGQDYVTPDGTCVRDYVHVSDLAQAHVLALKLLESGEAPLALNVGTGRGYSVREVIGAVERVTNCRVPCRYGDRRSGDPAVLVSDSRTIRQTFGWLPVRSDIDTIVRTAYEWHRKQTTIARD